MMRHARVRLLGLLAIAAASAALSALPVRAQETPVEDTDLGTITLGDLQRLSPSRVFRPIDMIGVRSSAAGWGMGGAHIANVEGVESVSWNPAGLGWLKRSDVTGDLRVLGSSGTTSGAPDTFLIPRSPKLNVTRYAVNLKSNVRYGMLGAATSREMAGRRVAGALSFRRYIDVAYPEEILEDLVQAEAGGYPVTLAFDDTENGGVDAATASVGIEAIPGLLSAGMNFNVLSGLLRTDEEIIVATGGPQNSVGNFKSGYNYGGHSFDLGVQTRYRDIAALGLRYTPGYTLEVRNGTFSAQSIPDPTNPVVNTVRATIASHDIGVPALLSAGLWFRVNPKLSAAFEWNQQKWQDAKLTYVGNVVPAGTTESLPLRNVSNWHVGLEGRILRIGQVDLPLRLGYRAGPLSLAPLEAAGTGPDTRPAAANNDIDTRAFTLGLGFETGNVRYDVGYEILDYTLQKFYFDVPYDAFLNRDSTLITVDRRVTALRVSATLTL